MKLFVRWLAVSLVSAAIALLLAHLPRLDALGLDGQTHVGVIASGTPKEVDGAELVDRLSKLPLNLNMSKMGWSAHVLSIDLVLPQAEVYSQTIFHDMTQIAYYGLAQTANIRQLLVRVMDYSQSAGEGRLLLAMNIKRGDLSDDELRQLNEDAVLSDPYLRTLLHFTYSAAWKQKFENFKTEHNML